MYGNPFERAYEARLNISVTVQYNNCNRPEFNNCHLLDEELLTTNGTGRGLRRLHTPCIMYYYVRSHFGSSWL